MVAQGGVATGGRREGSQTETGAHVGCHQTACQQGLLVAAQQPSAHQVTDVAGEGVDRPLRRVECDRRVSPLSVVDPEPVPEPVLEVLGPGQPPVGARPAEPFEQRSSAHRCLVGVALHLAQRDRCRRETAVPPPHRVAGVLPALVGQPAPGRVDVLQEPVAVGVAVLDHPPQARFERGQERLHVLLRHTPAPRVVQ